MKLLLRFITTLLIILAIILQVIDVELLIVVWVLWLVAFLLTVLSDWGTNSG
jgi:predicted membrane protein